MDRAELEVDNATLGISPLRLRTAEEVAQCASTSATSIEACEQSDLKTSAHASHVYTLRHVDVQPDDGIPLTRLHEGLGQTLAQLADPRLGESLRSIVLTLRTRHGKVLRKRSWWLGHLSTARAPWPIAASDVVTRDGERVHGMPEMPWDGRAVRISGSMQDPFLPRSRQQSYWENSTWMRGMTVRTRTGGVPAPFRSPVAGIVVWSAPYIRSMPPYTGADAGVNDERDWCVMVQDVWGTVYQLFGMARGSERMRIGQRVQVGDVLGYAHHTPLSEMPESQAPPADPPRAYAVQGFQAYPYRFRRLELRVGRTECARAGAACFAPDANWTYFPPQLVLAQRAEPSTMPPFVEPHQIYFAPASSDPRAHVPVAAPRSAAVHPQPLSGKVDVISTFASFETTPGDPDDALDPLALYALEWAAVPSPRHALCDDPSVYWRRSFEHSRLPSVRDASLNDTSFLLALYLPTVVVGSAAGHAFRAQIKSQFDEKERALVYALSRTHLGRPRVDGAWDIRREPARGLHGVAVRAWDLAGNHACTETTVHLTDAVAPQSNIWQPRPWHSAVLQSTLLGLPEAAATLLVAAARLLWILL